MVSVSGTTSINAAELNVSIVTIWSAPTLGTQIKPCLGLYLSSDVVTLNHTGLATLVSQENVASTATDL